MSNLTLIIRDTLRAITSGWGDTFFTCMGAVCAAIFAAIMVSAQPGYFSLAADMQAQTLLIATISTTLSFFSAILLIYNPIFAAKNDQLVRSYFIALTAGVVFIFFKLAINHSGGMNTQSNLVNKSYAVVILICLIAPIVEEYFFRGLIWRLYRERNFSEQAILTATTILFSFGHLPSNIFDLFQIAFAGMCLGIMRMYSGSVYLGIIIHAVTNFIVLFNL